jgi:hypothetical protein
MKRWPLFLTAIGLILLVGWGLHRLRWNAPNAASAADALNPINKAAAMDSQSGWRYRQNLPHHWRYIMLQK